MNICLDGNHLIIRLIILHLLLTSGTLYGQAREEIKTNAERVAKDYKKSVEQSKRILSDFFGTKNLDTIASYRPRLSGFRMNDQSYDFTSDSINTFPDDYCFFYDFFQKEEVIKSMYLIYGRKKKGNIIDNPYQFNGLEGIRILLTGASRITRDSIGRIAERYFPGERTLIELKNNYHPFDNSRKVISHYWTIIKDEDLKKNEFRFLRVELLTGEIETYVQNSNRID